MNIVLLIAVGFIVGLFVISMGGGGAAIYLGVLTAVFHLAPDRAAATSLITALPSLVIGSFGYFRQGKINFQLGNQMLVAALPAVIVGSLISPYIPATVYQWIVGVILFLLGVQIFMQRNHGSKRDTAQPSRLKASLYGVLSGLMVGVAGLSGGGPILTGLLLMGLDMFAAVGTSSYVLVGMTLVGALLHLSGGRVDWTAGIGLMIGAIGGALLAPFLLNKLSQNVHAQGYLKLFIAVLLMIMGVKTVF